MAVDLNAQRQVDGDRTDARGDIESPGDVAAQLEHDIARSPVTRTSPAPLDTVTPEKPSSG